MTSVTTHDTLNLATRFVVICMEYQGEDNPGWPDLWAAFPTLELAEAAETGFGLVDNDNVYPRIWDRLDDVFVDCFAADREDDEVGQAAEAAELAEVHHRLAGQGLAPFKLDSAQAAATHDA